MIIFAKNIMRKKLLVASFIGFIIGIVLINTIDYSFIGCLSVFISCILLIIYTISKVLSYDDTPDIFGHGPFGGGIWPW